MKQRNKAPRVHFSLLVLCYLEVVLWTACLLTSSTTLPSEALAGQGYLQRETGNLKNLIQVSRSGAPLSPGNLGAGPDGSCAALSSSSSSSSSSPSSSPSGGGASSSACGSGSGGGPSFSSPWALGGGWPLYARELLAGERHFHLERFYLRQVLASWAALGFLPSSLALSGGSGGPLRPTPDATGLPAPFAGIKALD